MRSASASASAPTPSMKVDLRRLWNGMPITLSPGQGVTPPLWRISPAASRTGIFDQG